jgi:hypothetical protein
MFSLKHALLTIALLGLAAFPACADELLSFKAGYQTLQADGKFAVSGEGVAGSGVDLGGELDFDDSKDFYLEAALQLGSFRLFGAYQPISFSGSGTLSENLRFSGETFVGGSHVDSDIDIDIYEAGIAWYLVNVDDLPARVQLGPELAIKYVNAHIEMSGTTADGFESESETVRAPVPTIGLRGRVALADFLDLVGRVGYAEYADSSFFDVDAQVEFSPLPMVGLLAGYRYLDIDIDDDNVIIDASFDGPYVGGLIRF